LCHLVFADPKFAGEPHTLFAPNEAPRRDVDHVGYGCHLRLRRAWRRRRKSALPLFTAGAERGQNKKNESGSGLKHNGGAVSMQSTKPRLNANEQDAKYQTSARKYGFILNEW
jgi:hypothetical protein